MNSRIWLNLPLCPLSAFQSGPHAWLPAVSLCFLSEWSFLQNPLKLHLNWDQLFCLGCLHPHSLLVCVSSLLFLGIFFRDLGINWYFNRVKTELLVTFPMLSFLLCFSVVTKHPLWGGLYWSYCKLVPGCHSLYLVPPMLVWNTVTKLIHPEKKKNYHDISLAFSSGLSLWTSPSSKAMVQNVFSFVARSV